MAIEFDPSNLADWKLVVPAIVSIFSTGFAAGLFLSSPAWDYWKEGRKQKRKDAEDKALWNKFPIDSKNLLPTNANGKPHCPNCLKKGEIQRLAVAAFGGEYFCEKCDSHFHNPSPPDIKSLCV